ncbi:MAG TPA: OmpA family protein, partial [Nevskiaceae bacterium]|nr:OmpA family protein [Nevskiaceae bacterium]
GKDNDGDGQVDFPADKGCTGADDNDEVDPCKTPAPGERVSLKGCGMGDVIVLRGVNFEFDKSNLTVNAKTILDNVAEELTAYPEIKVEVGGHTDAKGSDEYNQKLSERRAASVVKYLESKGIAGDRMTSAGYGESKPVADNETDEGRELNRRVELKITEGVAGASAAAPVAAEATAPAPDAVPATP